MFFFSLLGSSIISYLREISVRIIVSNQVVAHNGKGIFKKKTVCQISSKLNKKNVPDYLKVREIRGC